MNSDPKLDVALKILKLAGHQIGDANRKLLTRRKHEFKCGVRVRFLTALRDRVPTCRSTCQRSHVLGPVNLECIDFLRTDIAGEERSIIRR